MTPCIEATGERGPRGHVRQRVNGRREQAHRLAWERVHGSIPVGLCVLHRCDNPPCINVDHLFLGTKGDNNRDRAAKGRSAPQHGESNPNVRLTQQQADTIRTDPRLHRLIAAEYGISAAQVSRIKNGRRWHQVPPK